MPTRIVGTVQIETEIADGRVYVDGDLSISVNTFAYEINGDRKSFSGVAGQAMTDNSTNYVFLDTEGALAVETTGWPTTSHIRLARVIALNGVISQVINERVFLTAALDRQVNYNSEDGESSTTSTTWQEKLSLLTPTLPAGTYVIQWYAEIRHSNTTITEYVDVRCRADDTLEIGYSAWSFPAFDDFSGFRVVELGIGAHTLDMDWRVQGGGTAYIRRARLFMWRIE